MCPRVDNAHQRRKKQSTKARPGVEQHDGKDELQEKPWFEEKQRKQKYASKAEPDNSEDDEMPELSSPSESENDSRFPKTK